MFDPTSRYYNIEVATMTVTDSDGLPREVRFVRRRFIPPNDSTTLVEHTVTQGERLDNITARYLGDPTQFWRVCDANNVMQPNELTDTIGTRIKIALPKL
ncbi:MAG: LysM domain-containing protein [Verrucomicrobia bacterium]|nr:LysM domain-containing protein [Verrucomicrobiota bacterium]